MLAERFEIALPEVVSRQVSADGTRKYLVRIAGGHEVETVYIPEEGRGTLCVSTQVGCTLNCTFCHTGTQRLVRNLTAAEIVGQMMLARDDLGEWPRARARAEGRGAAAVERRADGHGRAALQLRERARRDEDRHGRRGYQPVPPPDHPVDHRASCPRSRARPRRSAACWRCASTPPPTRCATSWCRSTGNGTSRRCWTALREYPRLSNSERITFEYVMLDGVNDSDEDARRLVNLIRGIPAKINLIPFNEWPGAPYRRSPDDAYPRLRDDRHEGRLCRADPHAPGRGHHGRLRPTQERERTRAEVGST